MKRLRSERESYPPYPTTLPDFSRPPGIRSYWLGHATNLVEISGIYILTDPVFEAQASPVKGVVKRITPAACQVSDLPPIAVILISHDHWDHLEASAVEKICERFPNVKIFAPLVVSDLISGWGYHSVSFDWREHLIYAGVDFTCFPARHTGCRYGFDRCERLWCSWLISASNVSIYFAGDTAIGPQFAEVRNHVGRPIDLALLPIAPQEPSDWMRIVHMGPADAFDMSQVLEARAVYPIHYGSFPFGPRPAFDDVTQVRRVWEGDNLYVINGGEHLVWNGSVFELPQ
jgi:L-ascorbate metabolism protein UlaG (beta-lactamase superfamily)